ncbi:hypothetical protein [Streptomyces sp. NPDC059850]|uniref:hypothetical protein n=1 Tax=Streptomyces sp. NPDC059850 TaxID=3346970 RepID=UPI003660A776
MREMKRLRIRLNRTQEEVVQGLADLAARLCVEGKIKKRPSFSTRQYKKWENDEPPPWPHADARKVLAAYWKRPLEELGLRPRDHGEPTNPSPPVFTRVPLLTQDQAPDVAAPPWLAQTPAGATSSVEWRIGAAEVDVLRHAADDMDAQDQQFGGNRLWAPTQALLLWVHRMIDHGIYDDELEQQLHVVKGKYTTSLGWFCYDAGLHVEARQYFSEALNAAMTTGDDVLASRTLSNMARQAVDLKGKGREAVRCARLAQAHAKEWQAPSRVIALLAIREAQGYARVGDEFNCEATIRRAWKEWERGPDERDPDWSTFLNEAEMACLEGMCRLDLGQGARAQKLLARSEALQDVAHSRNRGMCLGRLSVAALRNGDIEHSVAATTESLRLIGSGMSSARTIEQLKIVHDGLAPHHKSRGVRDLLEQIRANVA